MEKDSPKDPKDVDATQTDAHRREKERPFSERSSSVERILPQLLKKGIEAGIVTIKQTDEILRTVGESTIAKEVSSYITSQIGDIRHILVNTVSREVGRVLEQTDISSELRKALSGMTLDIDVKIKFTPEGGQVIEKSMKVDLDPKD